MLGYKNFRIIGQTPYVWLVLGFATSIWAQGNGMDLAFQGIANAGQIGVKSIAMGGAYTAHSGDLNSLFWNPAGLATIQNLQWSLSGDAASRLWREHQRWNPNQRNLMLPFILDGIYTPRPEDNGVRDDEIPWDSTLSSFVLPEPGLDVYSEEAADWEKEADYIHQFNRLAAAIPLKVFSRHVVLAGSFNRYYDVNDFDRNDTHLDPHIGDRVGYPVLLSPPDTLRMNWARFVRERTGGIYSLTGAIAYQHNEKIQVGAGVNFITGTTDDFQSIDKVGYFDLFHGMYSFTYDTLLQAIEGSSKFTGTQVNLGGLVSFGPQFSLGINIRMPYALTREWDYEISIQSPDTSFGYDSTGTDRLEYPVGYSLGLIVRPTSQLLVSLDIEQNPYSNAKFDLAGVGTTQNKWADQRVLRFGIEYRLFDFLSILGGYRDIPQVFIPQGAANREAGPSVQSYSFGLSLNFFFNRIDIAYELRRLKYWDAFETNVNYVFESSNRILIGYMVEF